MGQKNPGKIIFLFIISYAVLYILSVFHELSGFGSWNLTFDFSRIDYFFALAPIAGFFLIFFLIDWIEKYFETKFTRSPWFGVLIFGLVILAYYVALFWFFCNAFSAAQTSVCSAEGAVTTTGFLSNQTPINNIIVNFFSDLPLDFVALFIGNLIRTEFVKNFLASPYVIFALSIIFGWISKIIVDRAD